MGWAGGVGKGWGSSGFTVPAASSVIVPYSYSHRNHKVHWGRANGGGVRGRLYIYRYTVWWRREIIYLPLHCLVKAVDYISIATLSGKRGRLYIYRYTVWWMREIICLSLHWWKREIIIIPIATLVEEGDYIPIATLSGGRGRLYTCRYTVWWKREIIYLSLYCHHQNDSCIKMGSDESPLNVSLIVRAKSQDSVHKPQPF